MKENRKQIAITIKPSIHQKGVELSKKELGKENFSRYVEQLIQKQND